MSVLSKKKVHCLGRNDIPDNDKWQKLHNFSQSYTLEQYFNHQILIKLTLQTLIVVYTAFMCV